MGKTRRTLRTMILPALCVGVALLVCSLHDTHFSVSYANNVDSVGWLPTSASNICYYRSYQYTAYEFDISESDFLNWCPEELLEIREPVSVPTWQHRILQHPSTLPYKTEDELRQNLVDYDATVSVEITNGLFFDHLASNGGYRTYVYDRSSGRAYVAHTPR